MKDASKTMMEVETPESTNRDISALKSVRLFSITALIGYIFTTISFVISISNAFMILSDFQGKRVAIISPMLILSITFSIVGFVVIILSLLFIREGYRQLMGDRVEFRSPYKGTVLYFYGLILALAGVVVIVSGIIYYPVLLLAGAILVITGGVMSFIGIILALIVGVFRLDGMYGGFAAAAVLFIFGLFFPVFSFVAAALIYNRTTRKIAELSRKQFSEINS